MVAIGFGLLALSVWFFLALWRAGGRVPPPRSRPTRVLLWGVAASGFAGFVAIEAGWMVTEVGRQPWVIYGVVRTANAITPAPGLIVSFVLSTLVYLVLAVTLVALLLRQARATREGQEPEVEEY